MGVGLSGGRQETGVAGRNSRGTLKAMRSSAVVTVSSVTSKRARKASMTSSTSASGAEAPAVTVDALDLCPRNVAGALDQSRHRAAGALGDLDEAQRVGALWAADDEQTADLRRDGFDGRLAIGRRVADVLLVRDDDLREAAAQDGDDRGRVVHRKRRLRHESQLVGIARLEGIGIGRRFDQRDRPIGELTHGADHLRMTGVADEQDLQAFLVMVGGLNVHLEH
jgi:hypothetical protein